MSNEQKPKKQYIGVGEAATFTGLDIQTIRKMADNAVIKCYKTPSGQRRIHFQSLQEYCDSFINNYQIPEIKKNNFLYARVSSKKQMDDLSRQIKFIQRPEYSEYSLITDVASGINFKRKGLSTILDSCLQGNIGEIVIAHKDRLCRFGYELIEQLVTKAGGTIKVLEENNNKTTEQELSEDLLAIIHVFSCKQMGKRNYSNRNKNEDIDIKNLSNSLSEK